MIRVPHPTDISAWVSKNHPSHQHPVGAGSRPGSRLEAPQFRPSLMASAYTDTAAFSESFDDVKVSNRQQPSPLLYSIEIWPARNSRLTQRETNHYITRCANELA